MEHNQIVSSVGRRITDTYTLPNNYRIKITTYHDKTRKAYLSYIAEVMVSPSGSANIVFERSTRDNLHKGLSIVNGLRYSAKDLHAAHAAALELGAELKNQYLSTNQNKEQLNNA